MPTDPPAAVPDLPRWLRETYRQAVRVARMGDPSHGVILLDLAHARARQDGRPQEAEEAARTRDRFVAEYLL